MARQPRVLNVDAPVTYVLGAVVPSSQYINSDGFGFIQIECKTDQTNYGGEFFQFDIGSSTATIRNNAKQFVQDYIFAQEGTTVPVGNIKIAGLFE